jgi:acetyl-CoA synthase
MKDPSLIEDHRITVIGPDLDSASPFISSLAAYVEVSGAKMRQDFEPVLERRIHHWFNYIEGVMHTGQRNLLRVRVSKDAYDKGLRLKHFGEVIYAMLMDEFGSVVDKCQITLITDREKVKAILDAEALPRYAARDSRLASMTDESVDAFYTCILCQSFAPAHCCVITPERLGLCGAVSWLDASATKELTPTGPCQPIVKGTALDQEKGVYTAVNESVQSATHGTVNNVTLYSLLEDPMTSCGCFECICGILPEANGVVIVNREFKGGTPTGMTFGELASMTGGGVQTPGFMGHGRHFIASKKFISAEGGVSRIVWMPKELKDDVAPKLNKTAKALYGIENFADMICDETIATESDAVVAFLKGKNHPAFAMEAIM